MSVDVYNQISELEAEVKVMEAQLARARGRIPTNGCGEPSHADLGDQIASQEALLARTTRGRRTTERLARGRGGRLDVEIVRVKSEIARLEPLAAGGDRALLVRLRAAQQRRRVLELKAKAPVTTAILPASSHMSLGDLERPPGRAQSASWLAWLGGALVTLFAAGTSTTLAVALAATLSIAIGLGDFAFPGARRDLVTAEAIYGERWKYVRSIEFLDNGTLLVETRKRTHRFTEDMVGYFDVVRLVQAAAVTHAIPIRGRAPDILALPAPGELSSSR